MAYPESLDFSRFQEVNMWKCDDSLLPLPVVNYDMMGKGRKKDAAFIFRACSIPKHTKCPKVVVLCLSLFR